MNTPRPNGWVAVIAAVGSCATTIGMAIVIVISSWQAKTLQEVELQGNSLRLEQQRVTAAALRTVATVKPSPENELKASDAERLYSEAKQQAEQNSRKLR